MGNVRRIAVERGGQYAKRPGAKRRDLPPDRDFDRQIAGIYATWRVPGRKGDRYATRQIANVAQHLQFPLRHADRHLEDGLREGVPTDLLKNLGRALIQRVDTLAAGFRRGQTLTPAA